MCEFVSWIEVKTDEKTEILFLTYDDIFNTSRGLELINHTSEDDLYGHGAISFYYQTVKGKHKECTDFSSPANFPPEIVIALKAGLMRGIVSYFPIGLLKAPLDAKYKADRAPLYAKYKADRDTLDAKYEADRAPLDAKYEADRDTLLDQQWDLFLDPDNRADAWK